MSECVSCILKRFCYLSLLVTDVNFRFILDRLQSPNVCQIIWQIVTIEMAAEVQRFTFPSNSDIVKNAAPKLYNDHNLYDESDFEDSRYWHMIVVSKNLNTISTISKTKTIEVIQFVRFIITLRVFRKHKFWKSCTMSCRVRNSIRFVTR